MSLGQPASVPASDLPAVCHSLMERSPVPMAELEGAGHVMRYVNPAFCRLADKSKEALVGKPFAEAMQEGDTCLAVLDRVYRTGEAQTHTEPEHPDPHPIYWSYAMWPVMDAQERPVGVMMQVTETTLFHQHAGAMNEALLVSSVRQHERTEAAEDINDRLRAEIVQRRRVESVLRENERRLGLALEASQLGQWDLNLIDHTAQRTFRHDQIFGYESPLPEWTYELFLSHVLPEDRAEVDRGFQAALATGEPWDFECRISRVDDAVRWIWARGEVDRDAAGVATRMLGTVQDITERKESEQRQRMLTNELAHRGKNLLGLIQTLVSRSISGKRSLAEAREALSQRIQALARSQTVLVHTSFEGASLTETVRLELEGFSDRVEANGPDVMLNSRAGQTFALVLHELATNASKYGALSRPGGTIAIDWSIERAAPDARFRFRWLERGGPPVAPPSHQGFGRTLIEKAAAHEFGAPPKVSYAPEGLSYEVDAPLSVVAAGVKDGNEPPGRDMSDGGRGAGRRGH